MRNIAGVGQNSNMLQSVDFFEKIRQINTQFKAMQRLNRPPAFKWAKSETDYDLIRPDSF